RETDLGTLDVAPGRLLARVVDVDDAAVENAIVRTMSCEHDEAESSTDPSGAAAFDLAPGPYGLRVDGDADASGAWQLVHVESGEDAEVLIGKSGAALFGGIVLAPEGPVEGVSIRTQRSAPMSNLGWSATTGPDGRFAFQPLMPGRYRYWISEHLVGHIDLAAGEPSDVILRIDGRPQIVELRRDGELLREAKALLVSARGATPQVWYRSERVDLGRFRTALPEGELLFQVDMEGLGNNQIALVPGSAAGGGDYVLDLPSTGIEVRFGPESVHIPNPAAYFLEDFDGSLESSWGPRSEVYAEPVGSHGERRSVRFPFLVPGTSVELRGVGANGERVSRDVRVDAGGWTVVRWP
ncbi:MAG: carboxypeptidase-like regulatory domain-containing protein, partial [Planctomycetota bacterium]